MKSGISCSLIGFTSGNREVYIDWDAAAADGIIVCHRVKLHTGFTEKIQSGLIKMMTIGLASCTTQSCVKALDMSTIYPTSVTSVEVQMTKIPCFMDNDKEAI